MAEGVSITWYPNTGTVQVQGNKSAKDRFEAKWDAHSQAGEHLPSVDEDRRPVTDSPSHQVEDSRIFVVHGHDDTSKEQLELVLHKLQLNPFVLANTSGGGMTIIEALEDQIDPAKEKTTFGIVLLTPDDMGYEKTSSATSAQPRARQNVVLEVGMLISAIGRPRVAILKKGHLELPSDAQGIIYIPYNEHVKETVPKLVDRLRNAGFDLAPASIMNAST